MGKLASSFTIEKITCVLDIELKNTRFLWTDFDRFLLDLLIWIGLEFDQLDRMRPYNHVRWKINQRESYITKLINLIQKKVQHEKLASSVELLRQVSV